MRIVDMLKAAAVAAAAMAGPSAALADTLEWHVRSEYPYSVQLEFYSQDYDSAWPGGDEAYVLDDSETHTFTLDCETGETICFGAWANGDPDKYWGAGLGGTEGCEDCCAVCGESDMGVDILQ